MTAVAQRIRILVLVVYAGAMTFLTLQHEPWRDEADVWLAVRDTTLSELFRLFPYMGTPSLWYLLVRPLARGGLPYESMALLHVAIATATAALILWRAPFSLITRTLLISSYYLAYEYAVIARPYALTILLLFAIAAIDHDRHRRPLLYASLVFLLASASAHGTILAGVIAASFVFEITSTRQFVRRHLIALVIMTCAGLAAWVQLRRPADAQIVGSLRPPDARVALDAIANAFLPFTPPAIGFLVGTAVLLLVVLCLRDQKRVLALFSVSFLALIALFAFVWAGGARHYGLLLIVTIFALWIDAAERVGHGASVVTRLTFLLLNGCLVVSIIPAANHWYLERRFAYSGAREAAQFLRSSGLVSREIAAHNATQAEALLPYLSGKRFWYIGRGEYGTYMKWDRRLDAAADVPYPVAEVLARRRFARKPFLLLFNVEIPQPERHGFRLLFRTTVPVFGRPDERYWVYEPID